MLAFLHTAASHVATFSRILNELGGTVPVCHEVRESLLEAAISAGRVTPSIDLSVAEAVSELVGRGARVVVCTCSTLGAAAERARVKQAVVMRIDRPMAEQAIARGKTLAVVAATSAAMAAAEDLLQQVARERDARCELVPISCSQAWLAFQRGDLDGYCRAVALAARANAPASSTVLLSQASMHAAAVLIGRPDLCVLSSPETGLRAALAAYLRVGAAQ